MVIAARPRSALRLAARDISSTPEARHRGR
jgi:hypothetical protein